ncbi:MAG: glycerol kinase GlpK [Thermoleophilia bacterium]|nr:glycerol kinase GlpK [Thermoleophilia bacterium]
MADRTTAVLDTAALRTAVMALDQGTTSSRAMVFGHDGAILGSAQEPFPQHYPEPGWVEHDPEDIWNTQLRCARAALCEAGLGPQDLAALGVTNQRETVLLWDAETGASLGNAIVWQCRRTAGRCEQLKQAGYEPTIQSRTGLRLDPYFSATKLEWLLAHREGAAELLAQGRLRAGTIDSFLIWRLTSESLTGESLTGESLTGGRAHVTDYSNASRTMLLDLERLDWADELLDLFGVPRGILPRLCPSSGVVAHTDPEIFGAAVPIAGIAGDQQAALFGQGAVQPGDCKNTYGTGCFLLANVGSRPVRPEHGLLSTVAWVLGGAGAVATGGAGAAGTAAQPAGAARGAGPAPAQTEAPGTVTYALEGSVFMAGAAVQWLRDGLGIIEASEEIGPLAAQAPDNGGVYFVPALTGLGAPYWDPYARGLLIGLTRGTGPAQLARATEEAICYQTRAVLDAMRQTSGVDIAGLRADGGASGDDFLLQLQADLLGVPVIRPRLQESTALGAAALAGLATGFWTQSEIAALAGTDRVFTPRMDAAERERLYEGWQRAVERSLGWAR